jgi:dTMP kinase
MKRGKFITFEGGEGSGKSTQIIYLNEYLKSKGYETFLTREPGGTRIGEIARNILQHNFAEEIPEPITELLLYEVSRAQLVRKVINPALEKGKIVLCNRFCDSTTAYQGYGRGFGFEIVEEANKIAVGDCMPDLTFLLDIPVEIGFARIFGQGRTLDRMEKERRDFHERLRNGYWDIASKDPGRFYIIEAKQDKEAVAREIKRAVIERLGL